MKDLPGLLTLVESWRWLFDPAVYELLDVSPFGDLFLRDPSGSLCLLDVNMGELIRADAEGDNPAVLFPLAFDFRMAHKYIQAGVLPGDGCCFGYKAQIVAGGSFDADNVYVAVMSEYVGFMGDFHCQIQDVADGEKIEIIVTRPRVQ